MRASTLGLILLVAAPVGWKGTEHFLKRRSAPFEIWQLRAGMPFADADELMLREEKHRFTCHTILGANRLCTVRVTGIHATLRALVDESDRIVVLRFHPDSASVLLREEGRKMAAEWNLVARGANELSDDVMGDSSVTRWRSGNRRWSASIRYGRLGNSPSIIAVADEQSVERIASSGPVARLVLQVNGLVDANELEYTAAVMRMANTPEVGDSSLTPGARRAGPPLALCEPLEADLPRPGSSTREALSPETASLFEAAVAAAYPGWRLIIGEGTWITDPSGRPELVDLRPANDDYASDSPRVFAVHLPARMEVSGARARDLRPEAHCRAPADIVIARHTPNGSYRDTRRIAVDDEALATEVHEIESVVPGSTSAIVLGVQYAGTYATERWWGAVTWAASIVADTANVQERVPISWIFDAAEDEKKRGGLLIVTGRPRDALEITTFEQYRWGVASRTVIVPLDSSGALSGVTLLDKLDTEHTALGIQPADRRSPPMGLARPLRPGCAARSRSRRS